MNLAPKDFDAMVGARIRTAREEINLSQQDLAKSLGFKDRQTLSHIEAGKRKVSSAELVDVMKHLDRDLDYFTDPYLIVGPKLFNWRASVSQAEGVERAEQLARPVISAYKRFKDVLDEPVHPFSQVLNITKENSYEDAARLGEEVADVLELGSAPAHRLSGVLESRLHLLILYMDLPDEVSGGACKLTEFSTIVVNRAHHQQRQAFTLAHELFHLLTWSTMTPERTEGTNYTLLERAPKEEKLADNFAAGLLMPAASLKPRWDTRDDSEDLKRWLGKVAGEYEVSAQALYYRLINLGWMTRTQRESVSKEDLYGLEKSGVEMPAPPLSPTFADYLRRVIEEGQLSVRKACELLDTNIEQLKEFFKAHELSAPFDL